MVFLIFIFCVFVLIVLGVLCDIIFIRMKPKAKQVEIRKKLKRKTYTFLSSFFLTQGSVDKVYTKLNALSIYQEVEIQSLVTLYVLQSWLISIGLCCVGVFLFTDTIAKLLEFGFAYLVGVTIIEKKLDNLYLKVMKEMSKALSNIRQEYLKSDGDLLEALANVEIPMLLQKPFNEILCILTDSEPEIKLREFYAKTPFRTLQTFAGVSFNVSNQGDVKDSHGASNYIQALTILTTDVNAEVMKIVTQKKKFGKLEYLPFIPMFGMVALESYFSGIMPGTALIYGGAIGYICKTITLVACILSYTIISRINTSIPIKEDDRVEWAYNMSKNPSWRHFILQITPKNVQSKKGKKVNKLVKLNRLFRDSLSKQSIEEFYTKKVVFGAGVLLASFIITVCTVTIGREFTKNSVQQLSLVASSEMEGYSKESIIEMDEKYFEKRDAMQPTVTLEMELKEVLAKIKAKLKLGEKVKPIPCPDLTDTEKQLLVNAYMPGLSDLQVIDQGKRMSDKYEAVRNTKFKWYFVWVCFLVGVIGYNIPNIMLRMRKILVKTEAEDDFLQLQTLISIYMTTNMDTLDTLHELAQHSRVHKDMLLYCYHSYPSNPAMELERLKQQTPIFEFKHLIDKLALTVDELALSEAFSDLMIERDQMMRMRELSIETTINKKRGLCGPIALLPLGCMVVGELIIPLGYLGFKEFTNALTMMG